MEKFIEDILQHQEKQTQLMSEIRNELAASNKRTPTVHVDGDSISQKAYGELRQPLKEATNTLRSATSNSESVTDKLVNLTREITGNFYGFTSQKSFLYFSGTVLILVLLFGSALYAYMDAKSRLSEANRHIRVIDNQVETWIEKNPKDSETFKKEVQHDLIYREL